jgi:two-component system, cell cycle response regulator DivK
MSDKDLLGCLPATCGRLTSKVLNMAQILLIDDDPVILSLLETVLTVKGHRSLTAADGEEGLRLAQEHVPALVITDLNLPKVTGWDIIKKLQSDDRTNSIPIIALSAHSSANDRDAAHSAGCTAYVTKPLDAATLVATVDNIFKD